MKKSIIHTKRETRKLAQELAALSLKNPKSGGAFVLALKGELGAGKTTFVKAFARALGVKENVLSPTFLIIKSYGLHQKTYERLWHVDCYRLQSQKELLALGWEEIVWNPKNIVAVEWADRVRSIIPKRATWISFVHGKDQEREITIMPQTGVR